MADEAGTSQRGANAVVSHTAVPAQPAAECGHATFVRHWTKTGEWCDNCYQLARRVLMPPLERPRPTIHISEPQCPLCWGVPCHCPDIGADVPGGGAV